MVCDPAGSGRATAMQVAPGVAVLDKFDDALGNNAIDAVAIAAPAVTHYALAKAALNAGKDVYLEKPLCLDESEGDELVRLADKHGKVLMAGLLQYHPCVSALQLLVASGDLGKLHYITSNRLNLGKILVGRKTRCGALRPTTFPSFSPSREVSCLSRFAAPEETISTGMWPTPP